MAKKFLSPLNLLNLTSDPGTAAEGDFYWNSSTNRLRIYFDGAWADVSSNTAFTNAANTFTTSQTITPATSVTGLTINAASSAKGLIVKANATTPGNLQEWQNSSGTALSYIRSDGGIYVTSASDNRLYNLGIGGSSNGISWLYVAPQTASEKPIVVRGVASQSANLTEWQDSASTVLASVSNAGRITAANGFITPNVGLFGASSGGLATLTSYTAAAGTIGLAVRGAASQSADLIQAQNSAGSVVFKVSPTGVINAGGATTIGNILNFSDPGIAVETRFNFLRATDSAWLAVNEYSSDSTYYEFGMSDNPSGGDYYQWRFDDWTAPGHGWMPLQIGAYITRFIAPSITQYGNIALNPYNTAFATVNNVLPSASNYTVNRYFPTNSTTYALKRDTGTGTGTATLNTQTYTGTSIRNYWIEIETGGTTFKWGIDSAAFGGTIATGVAITGSAQTLDNGLQVTLSTTGHVAGDRWSWQSNPRRTIAIGGTPITGAMQIIYPSAALIGTVIRGASGQTANLQEWQNSSGNILSAIGPTNAQFGTTSSGVYPVGINSTPTTDVFLTVGTTGYVSANTANQSTGIYTRVVNTGTGDIVGVLAQPVSSNATGHTNISAFAGSVRSAGGAGSTVTNGYVFWATGPTISSGTITNLYGLYLTAQKTTGVTNAYGIFQAGADDLNTINGRTTINSGSTTYIPLIIKGIASQSANLQEWQSSAGTVLARISSSGQITASNIKMPNSFSVGLGTSALNAITTGDYNVAVGINSLLVNSTGSSNIAIGYNVLDQNTTGGDNIGIGYEALSKNVSSYYNIAIGTTALYNATGENNTVVGAEAGYSLTTGNNNTIIGYAAAASSATVSNEITLGNGSVTSLRVPGISISAGTTSFTAPAFIPSSSTVPTNGMYLSAANTLNFATNTTNRMSIDSSGAITIPGSLTVTGDVTINGTTTNINTTNLVVEDKNIILGDVTTPSNTTADGGGITLKGATDKTFNWVNSTSAWTSSEPIIANSFIPSSSTVPTNGMYLSAANTLNFATNTTNRMVIDSSGNVGIGTTPSTGYSIQSSKNLTGAVTAIGFHNSGTIQSDVTTAANIYYTTPSTAATSFTLANLRHYMAVQGTFGLGSSVTNQIGFIVNSNLTGATNNYGFYGDIPSGANRWNMYMNGTANNYMAGGLGIGSTNLTGVNLRIGKTLTGATTGIGALVESQIQSDVTSVAKLFNTYAQTQSANFAISQIAHLFMDGTSTFANVTAGGTVGAQYGVYVGSSLTGASSNYALYSEIASGANRWNVYMNGTAANYFAGQTTVGSTSLTLGNGSVTHQFGVIPASSTNVGIVVRSAASQTGNLQEWQNSSGGLLVQVDGNGGLQTYNYALLRAGSTTTVPLSVRGAASQTANLQEWQNSAGTGLAGITSGGQVYSSYTGGTAHFRSTNSSNLNTEYNFILSGENDTGGKAVHFVNSSTRTNDGGANAYTIRNDGGPLNLGSASYQTNLLGTAISTGAQIISTLANSTTTGGGQIYLNGTTGNRIDFNTNGTGAPAFTTRSVGTKIVLYPNISGSTVDYAIGIDNSTLWQSVLNSTGIFKWYAGTTQVASLSGAGLFTAVSKSFDIQHPTKPDMRLRYGSLEGPENGVYVRGVTKENVIELPEYWTGLVDESTITATISSVGKFQKVYVEKIEGNKVYIGGRVKEISYVVFGERKDIDKIIVEY